MPVKVTNLQYRSGYKRQGGSIFGSIFNMVRKFIPKILPTARKGLDIYNKNRDKIKEVANVINQTVTPKKYREKFERMGNRFDNNRENIEKVMDRVEENPLYREINEGEIARNERIKREGGRTKRGRGRGFKISDDYKGGAISAIDYFGNLRGQQKFDDDIKKGFGHKKIEPNKLSTSKKLSMLLKK